MITPLRNVVSPAMLFHVEAGLAMMTSATRRVWILTGLVLVALGVSRAARATPPAELSALNATGSKRAIALRRMPPEFFVRPGFYEAYLVPQMSARFRDDIAVTSAEFANAMWTPLTRDPVDEARIQKLGIRAVQGGLKRYAIELLGIGAWSLPVIGRGVRDGAATANGSRGLRFRVGISRRAPRADLLIPVAAGRVVVSGDVRGRVCTTFESISSRFRLSAQIDGPERSASVDWSLRF